ncbi:MAG: NBR1-Ig-like domain-containing protein [Anaerolineaceae bacterium]|nr:NBR1-Ig-like domain-containing protein [Anaerolineaceae bacterium]
MQKKQAWRFICMFAVLTAFGCKPKLQETQVTPGLDLGVEALAQTAVARVTVMAFATEISAKPSPSPIPTLSNPTAAPTLQPFPSLAVPTAALPCNLILPGSPIDVSIPDGTVLNPGQEFVKTWRIINGGSCPWTALYQYSFYSGNPMGAHQANRLKTEIQSGQAVDISVSFYAPIKPGEYESAWMLQDENGDFFGMGLNADAPFFVKILVAEAAPSATANP